MESLLWPVLEELNLGQMGDWRYKEHDPGQRSSQESGAITLPGETRSVCHYFQSPGCTAPSRPGPICSVIRDKITDLQADDLSRWWNLSDSLFSVLGSFCEQPEFPSFPSCLVCITDKCHFSFCRKEFSLGPASVEERILHQDELECSFHHKTIISGWDKAPNKAARSRKGWKKCVPSHGAILPIHQLQRKIWDMASHFH